MNRDELKFEYPESLVAREPQRPSRVMWVDRKSKSFQELAWADFLLTFSAQDVIVRNNTKVIKRRMFAKTSQGDDFEVLFVGPFAQDPLLWNVLCPASRWPRNTSIQLPNGSTAELVERGRVQTIRLSAPLSDRDFEEFGEVPLPPYIQKARGERHTRTMDSQWYQTEWAKCAGSSAAPTASLHFSETDFDLLRARGVTVLELTLHVGLGTYLPVLTENLLDHRMHFEDVEISASVWNSIQAARAGGRRIWSVGTTVTRALESAARGRIPQVESGPDAGNYRGATDLLILPGFEYTCVDRLITNFHQPESTLLALVMAFAEVNLVREAYLWAINHQFRLFSYGDLSVWT